MESRFFLHEQINRRNNREEADSRLFFAFAVIRKGFKDNRRNTHEMGIPEKSSYTYPKKQKRMSH